MNRPDAIGPNDRSRVWGTVDRFALPATLVFFWVASALTRRIEAPPLAAEVMATLMFAPMTLWAFSRRRPGTATLKVLGFGTLPVVVMVVSALLSADPRVSVIGGMPLHQGGLLWAGLLGWFAVAVIGAAKSDLLACVKALSLLGTASAVWALGQWAGLLPAAEAEFGRMTAQFDNPMSLTQALLLSTGSTFGLLAMARTSRSRALLSAGAVAQVLVLAAADVRAAWVGAAVGLGGYLATTSPASRRSGIVRLAGAVLLAGFGLAYLAGFAATAGLLGPGAFATVDQLTTQRATIWRQAAARVAQHPWFGEGPGLFDTINAWSVLPDGRLDVFFTYDAHGLLVDWIVSAGALGFIAMGVAVLVYTLRMMRLLRASGWNRSLRLVAAGVAAAFVAMQASWPDPSAALCATVVVGAMLAVELRLSGEDPPVSHRLRWIAPVAAAVGCGVALSVTWATVEAQQRASAVLASGSVSEFLSVLERDYLATGDEWWLSTQLAYISRLPPEDVEGIAVYEFTRRVSEVERGERPWSVDIPILTAEALWMDRDRIPPDDLWNMTVDLVDQGRQVEPDARLWYYLLARAAIYADRPEAEQHLRELEPGARIQGMDEALQNLEAEER